MCMCLIPLTVWYSQLNTFSGIKIWFIGYFTRPIFADSFCMSLVFSDGKVKLRVRLPTNSKWINFTSVIVTTPEFWHVTKPATSTLLKILKQYHGAKKAPVYQYVSRIIDDNKWKILMTIGIFILSWWNKKKKKQQLNCKTFLEQK